jgi:hypothetical protein
MSGVYFRFTIGRAGTAGENARYITRCSATGSDREAVYLQNYPAAVTTAAGYDNLRASVIDVNRKWEADELRAVRRGGGVTRGHYRARASFEGKVDTAKAVAMAREYLEKNFADARAVACVHQDTDHTHVHINMAARLTTGNKLHFSQGTYKRLDKGWASIYAREFGREKLREHELKKEEMREVKREYAQALARGEEFTGRWPERVDRPYRSRDHQEREARIYGIDETRVGRGERSIAIPDHGVREGERIVAETVRTVEGVREELGSLLERDFGRESFEIER